MMVLYSGTTCPFSQRCRFVLFEKGMDFEIRDIDLFNKPEDINVMNPYGQVPILVERDLVLYESNIINEYIDERFPHPQLMPPDPVMRARTRLFLYNFEKELFVHVGVLENRAAHDEAALALGMSRLAALLKIVLPQAVRRVLPVLASTWVSLFKDTSLVSVIAVGELAHTALEIRSQTYRVLELLTAMAVIYWALGYPQAKLVDRIHRRWGVAQ